MQNAVSHPKQVIQQAKNTVKKKAKQTYQKVASAGSRFVKAVSNGGIRGGFSYVGNGAKKVYSSFKSYAAKRTSEIRATIHKEMCTTNNRISSLLGKVDWNAVKKVVAGGVILGGLAAATVLTGGAAAVIVGGALSGALIGGGTGAVLGGISSAASGEGFISGAADGFLWGTIGGAVSGGVGAATGSLASSTASSALKNPLAKSAIENAADTAVGTIDDLAHGRDVTAQDVALDFAKGMISDGIKQNSYSENNALKSSGHSTSKNPEGYKVGDVDDYKHLSPGITRAEGNRNIAEDNRVQAHHIIQDKWAKENLDNTKYKRKEAPSILLETGTGKAHTSVTNSQRQRRKEVGYDTDINTEFRESYKDLINSGVDSKTAQKAIKKSYKYFDGIGAFKK